MEDVRLKTVFNPPMSHILHSFSLSSFDMILRVDVLITHPDERAVGVLPGGSTGHDGGARGEPPVHRYKSNSKPVHTNPDFVKG